MSLLNRVWFNENVINQATNKEENGRITDAPVTILQVGEGNFLRGFFDWMIAECRKQGLYHGSIAVTQPRPHGAPKIAALAEQDGLYTLVTRGIEQGQQVERVEIIDVFGEVFDPYQDWSRWLAQAKNEHLQLLVSNTTEAGLVYRPEERIEGTPIQSFPGKVTELLYQRYEHFKGAEDKGLVLLPCELLERNGDALRDAVLEYASDWDLPEAFVTWVKRHNRFLNSLVDRIVTGYPDKQQATDWEAEWGYEDKMLNTAEPYHLWAIEAGKDLESLLPLQAAGLGVHLVEDLTPFQKRKVRILNGAHTLMTPIALLHDFAFVRETMESERWGGFVRRTVEQEIVPTLPYASKDMLAYAGEVYERFLNPFIQHRLADIAMNSLSKFKVRVLPSLLAADKSGGLLAGLSGLVRYYQVQEEIEEGQSVYAGTTLSGKRYVVRDDAAQLAVLAEIWAQAEKNEAGVRKAVEQVLGNRVIWGEAAEQLVDYASLVADQLIEWELK